MLDPPLDSGDGFRPVENWAQYDPALRQRSSSLILQAPAKVRRVAVPVEMGCSQRPDLLYSCSLRAPVTVTCRGCDTGSGVMNLIHARALPAAVVAVGFAILARAMGSVTDGGALAGVLVAFVLMVAGGFAGFIPLLTLFLLTVISTAWGYKRKQRLGVAERKRGRTVHQVLANLGAAALCAVPVAVVPGAAEACSSVAAVAALAEAAADTVSSEMGQATARAPT